MKVIGDYPASVPEMLVLLGLMALCWILFVKFLSYYIRP